VSIPNPRVSVPDQSLSEPEHSEHSELALSNYSAGPILTPYAPGYSFLAEFARTPDLLPLYSGWP
jgi:hypothetical protein